IDKIRDQLGANESVSLTIDRTYHPGQTYPLDAARLLSGAEIFKSKGVTVTSSTPAVLNVYVDELIEKELPVEAPREVTNRVASAIFDPPNVKIRGPRSAFDKAEPHAYADLRDLDGNLKPGEPHELPSVRVQISDQSLVVAPSTVKATVTVRDLDVPW